MIEQGKIGQILSARPTDRRQLIEEAAGVTKYKSRRRAAELKLEAAQQNLTRVDDIVFEVEKQRGTLKRQAAKARRYKRLREELRRWEKVQFAERYRVLGEAIETARTELADARERETAAAAQAGRARNDARASAARADGGGRPGDRGARSGARERAGNRPAAAADRLRSPADRAAGDTPPPRSRPRCARSTRVRSRPGSSSTRAATRPRRAGSRARRGGGHARSRGSSVRRPPSARSKGSRPTSKRARSEVFAAVNAATALRHAMEHAVAARARMAEQIAALEVEEHDLGVEAARAAAERATAARRARARPLGDGRACTSIAPPASRSSPARAPIARRALIELRTREHELAALIARLTSLEELDAARAEYGDGARTILAESPDDVGQMGSVADYLEVDRRYERAVEASLGDRCSTSSSPVARACGGRPAARPRSQRRPRGLRGRESRRSGRAAPAAIDAAAGLTPLADRRSRVRPCGRRDSRRSRARLGGAGLRLGPGGRRPGARHRRRRSKARSFAAATWSRAACAPKRGHSRDQARDQGAARARRRAARGRRPRARGARRRST